MGPSKFEDAQKHAPLSLRSTLGSVNFLFAIDLLNSDSKLCLVYGSPSVAQVIVNSIPCLI